MFIAILTQPKVSNTLLIGCVAGILAAMTTGFPGGQIPNIIDKLVTAFFVLGVIRLLGTHVNVFTITCLGFIGTIFSGVVFLSSALLMVGLSVPFTALLIAVVLPAALANSITSAVFFKTYHIIVKPYLKKIPA